jgi:RES domain-containing protein
VVNTLRLWRLCRDVHAAKAFSGEGPFRYGGRWNPTGVQVVYCAESRSLAAMEILVHHLGTEVFKLSRWVVISVDVPEAVIEKPPRVPDAWREQSPIPTVQEFGARWVRERRSAVLRVPSAVVLGEFNYLLNPVHPDFEKIAIGKPGQFLFDTRFRA